MALESIAHSAENIETTQLTLPKHYSAAIVLVSKPALFATSSSSTNQNAALIIDH